MSNFLTKLSPLLLALTISLTIVITFKLLPPKLPLFYSVAWGEAQLATKVQFLILPASIIFITLLNLVIAWQLHSSQSFFKQILLISSITVSLVLTITFVKIVLNFI